MFAQFDNTKVIANTQAINSAYRITDLNINNQDQTVTVSKSATIPLLGHLISWIRFVLTSESLMTQLRTSLGDFKNQQVAQYNTKTLEVISNLFHQTISVFKVNNEADTKRDIEAIKTYRENISNLAKANPLGWKLITPEVRDNLKLELKQQITIAQAAFKKGIIPEMPLSMNAILNTPRILRGAMSVEGLTSYGDYFKNEVNIQNLDETIHVLETEEAEIKSAKQQVENAIQEAEKTLDNLDQTIQTEIQQILLMPGFAMTGMSQAALRDMFRQQLVSTMKRELSDSALQKHKNDVLENSLRNLLSEFGSVTPEQRNRVHKELDAFFSEMIYSPEYQSALKRVKDKLEKL